MLYTLNDLIDDCHNAKNVQLNEKYYQREWSKIKKLKNQEEALFNFNK